MILFLKKYINNFYLYKIYYKFINKNIFNNRLYYK